MGTVPQTRDGTPNIEYWEWKFEDEDEDEEEGKTSNIEHSTSNFQFEDKSSGGAPKGTGEAPVLPWEPALNIFAFFVPFCGK